MGGFTGRKSAPFHVVPFADQLDLSAASTDKPGCPEVGFCLPGVGAVVGDQTVQRRGQRLGFRSVEIRIIEITLPVQVQARGEPDVVVQAVPELCP